MDFTHFYSQLFRLRQGSGSLQVWLGFPEPRGQSSAMIAPPSILAVFKASGLGAFTTVHRARYGVCRDHRMQAIIHWLFRLSTVSILKIYAKCSFNSRNGRSFASKYTELEHCSPVTSFFSERIHHCFQCFFFFFLLLPMLPGGH